VIPISELHSIDLNQGVFRNRLFIKVRSMTTLADVPGNDSGHVELRVARRDKATAQTLVSLLMLGLSKRNWRISAGKASRRSGYRGIVPQYPLEESR
jgi:hypothetical protein